MPIILLWPTVISRRESIARQACNCGASRQAAIDALAELRVYAPARQWRLIQVAGSLGDVDRNRAHLLGELQITLPA